MRGKIRIKRGFESDIKGGIRSGIRELIMAKLLMLWLLGILFAGMCFGAAKMTALAGEEDFAIDAVVMPQVQDTYDIRLTVQNSGQDWEGVARLCIEERYSWYTTAYDTALSLPQGSTKQFVVRIPRDGQEVSGGTVKVVLLDRKSQKSAEKEFDRLLQDAGNALGLGILSDAYSTLTYLDMGGEELYFGSDEYPVRLVELNQDNLVDALEGLTILVIDRYDTSVLTEEEVKALELWNYNGGVLVVGTGSYGDKTLAGLDYLEMECQEILQPGESAENVNGYVDFSRLSIARLRDLGRRYGDSSNENSVMVASMGDGAAGVVPYGLSELGEQDSSVYIDYINQETFVYYLLNEVCREADSRYTYATSSGNGSDNRNILRRILGVLGNSSGSLNFSALRIIVILYVIFVGPLLYLILRLLKKRELYWVAVPVAAAAGIFLVFLAGRGFEVVSTRVYSVTVQNLSGNKGGRTYLHCYDADHGEWGLRLTEEYDYVGPYADSYHYGRDENDYYHHIRREGDRLIFGIRAGSSFEDSYFSAGGFPNKGTGELSFEYFGSVQPGVSGTVVNGTDRNFAYIALVANDSVSVYKGLAAGERRELPVAECIYNNLQNYRSNAGYGYLYDLLEDMLADVNRKKQKREDVDMLAALGVGIFSVYPELGNNDLLIMGVTADWDKAIDDTCGEISYGCLYAIQ